MPPISEQFYDDDDDEAVEASDSPSSDETMSNELKVSQSPPCAPYISEH
jgi:hypothetical protein